MRKYQSIFLFCFILCQCNSQPIQNTNSQKQDSTFFYLGGIQVNEPNHEIWVNTLKNIGMNTVEVTVYAKQGDWDSDNLWWEEEEPYVVQEIQAAKKAGLKVVLILRVYLDSAFPRNKFLWHGMIMPQTDSLRASWFEKYTRFVNKWSKIAEEEKVDVLGVGSEMRILTQTLPVEDIPSLEQYYLGKIQQENYINSILAYQEQIDTTESLQHLWEDYESFEDYLKDEVVTYEAWAKSVSYVEDENPVARINERRAAIQNHWLDVIKEARKHYSGKMLYAANFDNFKNVGFWSALDMMGINAYYQLRRVGVSDGEAEKYDEMVSSWEDIIKDIQGFQKAQSIENKPIIFSELGYIATENCTLAPWKGYDFSLLYGKTFEREFIVWEQQKADEKERAQAVNALYEAKQKLNWNVFQGILYWKLTTKPEHQTFEAFALPISTEKPRPLQEALTAFTKDK